MTAAPTNEHESAAPGARLQPDPRSGKSLAGRRAVVVEDEGITQMQLRKILLGIGVEIVGTAATGQAAIELVLRERPDFVLMDIQMPVMNGLDATEAILKTMQVCIIMLTAYSADDYRARAAQAGACGYVVKPVTAITLVPSIAEAFERYTVRNAPQTQ